MAPPVATVPPAADVDVAQVTVTEFFRRYAAALDAGDLAGVADLYGEPTFVITDASATVAYQRASIVRFLAAVRSEYSDRGLTVTRSRVEHVEVLSDHLVDAVVDWTYDSATSRGAVSARHRYMLRRASPRRLLILTTAVLRDTRSVP